MRIIEFSDGFTSSSAPSAVSASITTNFLSATGATFKDKNAGITYLGGFRVANYDDPTKVIDIDISGATALKKTTLAFNQTLDRVVSFPNATTTLLGHDSAQVITNKDIDGGTASNTNRITVPKDTLANLTALTRKEGTLVYATDTDKFYRDDGSTLSEIGSGSGSSINYIGNPDAESSTTGWSTYDDGAATPVDGTGGTVTTTLTRSTSSPLRGVASFLITTTAANLLGEGVAVDFTISNADLAKVLNISFDYSIASGTYVTGDFTVYIIQDPSGTPTVIQPTPYQLQALTVGLPGKFQATFQTSSTITTYRLLIHRAVSTSSACTIKLDNVVVGPQIQLYGAPITDWETVTCTTSWVSNSSCTGFRRRVGDSEEYDLRVSLTGAPTSTGLVITLPNRAIDTSKTQNSASNHAYGRGTILDSGTTSYEATVGYSSTTAVAVFASRSDSTYTNDADAVSQVVPMTFASGDAIYLRFIVPISGWSSTVQMSNDTDTRVCAAKVTGNPASAADGNPIIFPTSEFDTHGAFSVSTGRFTAPMKGVYSLSFWFDSSATSRDLFIYVDGSASTKVGITDSAGHASATVLISLNAGQLLDMRPSGGACDVATGYISVQRLSGPSAIAASEKIYLQYTSNAGTSLTANTTNIDYSVKVNDSHGAWSGTVFTAPRASLYTIIGNVSLSTSASRSFGLYVNGSQVLTSRGMASGTDNSVSFVRYLNAGDTCSIRCEQTGTLSNSSVTHWISIYSQG